MRRLVSLVAMLLLLTACTTAKRSQGTGAPSGNLKTYGPTPRPTDQASASKPAEQAPAAAAPKPTNQTPAPAPQPAVQTPVAPATTTPSDTPCTWPFEETLKAKGRLLLADGRLSFYKMAWGADCTDGKAVDAWLVQDRVVVQFLPTKRGVEGVQAVALLGGDRAYLVQGAAVGAATRAYYVMVLRNSRQQLYRFTDEYGKTQEALSSTDYPEVRADQLSTVEREGTGSEMHYRTRTWQLDPQSLTAVLIKGKR